MLSFLTILLNCADWAIMVPVARVKIKPTLERKVKNKGKKGIFLVRKWISNTFNSNSVQYQMHYRKKSLLFV